MKRDEANFRRTSGPTVLRVITRLEPRVLPDSWISLSSIRQRADWSDTDAMGNSWKFHEAPSVVALVVALVGIRYKTDWSGDVRTATHPIQLMFEMKPLHPFFLFRVVSPKSRT